VRQEEMKEDQVDIAYHMPFLEAVASQASFILEIGVGWGNGSTRAFARGLKRSPAANKLHIGVDWNPVLEDPASDFERPDSDYWQLVLGKSERAWTAQKVDLVTHGRVPDVIFIDTDHNYDQMSQELRVWSRLAGPSTLWIFHDTWQEGSYNRMTDAIKEYCVEHPEWEFVDYSQDSHGLGLMRRKA